MFRRCVSAGRHRCIRPSVYAPDNRYVQFAYLLSERVAVESEQCRCLDLVAAGGFQTDADQWPFDLVKNPFIDSGCRQGIAMCPEIIPEVAFHRSTEAISAFR